MIHMLCCKCSDAWGDIGTLVLRLALGLIFVMHGYQKVFEMGHEAVAGFMGSLGLPLASLMAYLVSYGELITGILLIVGLFTHWAAKIDIVIAIVAFLTVHMSKGFFLSGGGYEYIMLIFASSVAVMISGAGKYSLDAVWLHKGHDHA